MPDNDDDAAPNANQNNPNGNNPPPPAPPAILQPGQPAFLALVLVTVGLTVAFSLLSVAGFLAAQGAVRREIERLRELAPDRSEDEHERHVLRD